MIPLDKQAHAWAGCAIFGLAVAVMHPVVALLLVAGAAVGKELWDRRTHPADWYDTLYTVGGGCVALLWTMIV